MLEVQSLSKLGIGGWGIGGFATPDPDNNDGEQVNAITYALKRGLNVIDVSYLNAEGKSPELIKEAIVKSGLKRDDLFLALVVYDYKNPTLADFEREIQKFFDLFKTHYVDTLQIQVSALHRYGFDEVTSLIDRYLSSGKARFTSLTNANLEQLQKFHSKFGNRMFSQEVHYSFEVRDNEYLGILDYADNHGIKNVIYQPLRRNRTAQRNWPLLVDLAKKYNKTQNQIILNWIVSKGYLPLNKSQNTGHVDENITALDFKLEPADIKAMNDFRVPNYKMQEIDWYVEGTGPTIFSLPNSFDEVYPNN